MPVQARGQAALALVVVHLLLAWGLIGLNHPNRLALEAMPLLVAVLSADSAQGQPDTTPALAVPQQPVLPTFAPLPFAQPLIVDAWVPVLQVPRAVAAQAEATTTPMTLATPAPASSAVPRRVEADAIVVSTAPPSAVAAAVAAPVTTAVPNLLPNAGVQFMEAPVAEYPRVSRRNGESGLVMVRAYVDTAGGTPRSVLIEQSSGFFRLDQAALAAVLRARFRPYVRDGRPTEGWALIPIRFELES